jgi:hypothetical protein
MQAWRTLDSLSLKIDGQVHGLKLPFVYDALPAKDMRQLYPVSAFDRPDLPDALYACKFSHFVITSLFFIIITVLCRFII